MGLYLNENYMVGNKLEWLKTSIEFAIDDEKSKRKLKGYSSFM